MYHDKYDLKFIYYKDGIYNIFFFTGLRCYFILLWNGNFETIKTVHADDSRLFLEKNDISDVLFCVRDRSDILLWRCSP
ncbi:hypothetical protein BXU10_10995 [Flavobacterium sp. LM4]|nr:hypothetical protein BXU10_10995 [Flavobacterium sp. LM4]